MTEPAVVAALIIAIVAILAAVGSFVYAYTKTDNTGVVVTTTPEGSPAEPRSADLEMNGFTIHGGLTDSPGTLKLETGTDFVVGNHVTASVFDSAPEEAFVNKAYVDTNAVTPGQVNGFSATQYFAAGNSFSSQAGPSLVWDTDANQVFAVELAANVDNLAIRNLKSGATYILVVKQDGAGAHTFATGTVTVSEDDGDGGAAILIKGPGASNGATILTTSVAASSAADAACIFTMVYVKTSSTLNAGALIVVNTDNFDLS